VAYAKNYRTGKRARATTKAGTDILWLGLSVCGSMIGIRRSNGLKDGTTSTLDLFWKETYLASGTRVIEVNQESGNEIS